MDYLMKARLVMFHVFLCAFSCSAFAAFQDPPLGPRYVSKDGGFELSPLGEVHEEHEELMLGTMRSIKVSANLGAEDSYSVVTTFFPRSLGTPEDSLRVFKIYSPLALCPGLEVEKKNVQGLPALLIHGRGTEVCPVSSAEFLARWVFAGNKVRPVLSTDLLSLWVFAGNRYYAVVLFVSSRRLEDARALLSSFKIVDPRFAQPGEWLTYESKEGKFSVSLPVYPKLQTATGKNGTLYNLMGYGFSATAMTTLQATPTEVMEFLEKSQRLPNQGTVVERIDGLNNGQKTRRLRISYMDSGEKCTNYVLIILGEKFDYILSVLRKDNSPTRLEDLKDVDRFFSSFKEMSN